MEGTQDPAVLLASQISVAPIGAPPVAEPRVAPRDRVAEAVHATTHLATLGVTGTTKNFATSAAAKNFIRDNMFMQSKGFGKGSPYCRFICTGCELVLRLHVNAVDEAQLLFDPDQRWHSSDCTRCVKGKHGLSQELRAAAVLSQPRRVVEGECKRVIDGAPKIEDGEVHIVNVTKRQAQNVRRYENKKHTALYAADPAAFFEKAYPGSKTSHGTFENAGVVCGIRPYLVSELIKQDQICVDATYWVAPKDGNVVTIGFTKFDTFIPVFFAVFEPATGEKCTESGDMYRYVFDEFNRLVRSIAGEHPTAETWSPRVAVRDHACAIRNGLRAVFPNCEDFICYFHVKQALERWLVLNHVCDELKKDMHLLMQTLHFSTDMETYLLGLRVAQDTLLTPMWAEFFSWNEDAHRMPGGACERWSLAFSQAHDTTTNCGIENWHGHLKKRVRESERHTMGHLGLRDCVELFLGEFAHIEHLLKGNSPRMSMPLYFETREESRAEDLAAATRKSVEYLHVLQKSAAIGQDTFRWTRVHQSATPDAPSTVVLLDTFSHGVVVGRRNIDWDSFLKSQAVHVTTQHACSCVFFQTNTFGFCKHVIAVQAFIRVCPIREVPAATPPRIAMQDLDTNTTDRPVPRVRKVTVKEPSVKRSRSRSCAVPFDVTPPPQRSWNHPAERPGNTLTQKR